jgi:hypothetical protein
MSQAGKANIYWRGYVWLSVYVSPESLAIPTYLFWWQFLLGVSSKQVKSVASLTSGDRNFHATLHLTGAAKRYAFGLF